MQMRMETIEIIMYNRAEFTILIYYSRQLIIYISYFLLIFIFTLFLLNTEYYVHILIRFVFSKYLSAVSSKILLLSSAMIITTVVSINPYLLCRFLFFYFIRLFIISLIVVELLYNSNIYSE